MENRPPRHGPVSPPPETTPVDKRENTRLEREEVTMPDDDVVLDEEDLASTRVIPGLNEDPTSLPPLPLAEDTQAPDPVTQRSIAPVPFPLADLPQAEEGKNQLFLDDFYLLKKLGEGAMGVVYKAYQASFQRKVALKVLFKHVGNNPKLVARLDREGHIMFQLEHPNIVEGYGIGEEEGWHYFVMEYVRGKSLQKWLQQVGQLSVADAVHIVLKCAGALDYAHHLGLIHRDVKPDNILISRTGEVKLTDFGMVKLLDEEMSLTQTGHAVGTPWYMPLEQARDAKNIDGRCDIYALGCLLYCLLTGQPPFVGRTLVDVIQAKEAGTFPPARKFNPEVPSRLDLIIAKMAAKLPQHRYQNCSEIIHDLEALGLANETLHLVRTEGLAPHPGESDASTKAPVPASQTLTRSPDSDESDFLSDIWYLRYRTPKRRIVVRKFSRAEIKKMIEEKTLDPKVKASRHPNQGFRALGTFKEFQTLLVGNLAKIEGDKINPEYHDLVKEFEAQEEQRTKNQVVPRKTSLTEWNWPELLEMYWRPGLIGLGILIGLAILLYIIRGFAI